MQGFTARIRYSKTGLIRFVGHLDTARCLLRAVRRAGIEGVYSEGFVPRLRLSFGPPLPLGCTSGCEYFDIRLAREYEPDSVRQKLQGHLPGGIVIEDVQVVNATPKSLHSAFWAEEYEIELPRGCGTRADTLEQPVSAEEKAAGSLSGASGRGRGADARVLRASVRERNGGGRVLSLVLRRSASGGVRLKEVISDFLGIEGQEVEKLRIHKKRVYSEGERA